MTDASPAVRVQDLRKVYGDKAAVDELLKGGDVVDTGLKVVVPKLSSPIKSEFRVTLEAFQIWLAENGLEGS